ncbi:DUF4365 domain-containing protein [Streptomyces sp. NPDC059982]|uniref:DUF4365 domain-containing protein n=1 Tax=unclassified Streptomyces TaxID=2593676 RepID=UPI0036B45BD1
MHLRESPPLLTTRHIDLRWPLLNSGGGLPVVDLVGTGGIGKPRTSHIEAVDPLTVTDMMEQLQQGYMASVAATAGCTLELIQKDKWGVDAQLIRPPRTALDQETMVFAQLKCTTQTVPDPTKEFFSYQFTKRQYFDHMVKRRSYPKAILIVMTTPPRQHEWTEVSHSGLVTRRSCYWAYLEGMDADPGVKKPTVRIPTKNLMDASALTMILDRIDRGDSLDG